MEFIPQLWLPILLSAVLVFAISAASHMLLPWRAGEFRHVPGYESLQAAVKDLPPGQYLFPAGPDRRERGSREAMERWAAGPSGWLTIVPREPIRMGRNMGLSFVAYLAVSFLVAYLASFTLGTAARPPTIAIVRVVSTVGVLAYAVGTVFQSIWYSRPWTAWGADVLDAIVQAFAMAAVFAWLWPS